MTATTPTTTVANSAPIESSAEASSSARQEAAVRAGTGGVVDGEPCQREQGRDPAAGEACFACGKQLKRPQEVWTSDPQMQWVGPECSRHVRESGPQGYQPPKGGPRLFSTREFAVAASAKGRT